MLDREAVLARAEKESPRELGLMLCQLADAIDDLREVLVYADVTCWEGGRIMAMVEKLTGAPQ